MNFEFSDEQVMLRDSLSRLLDQRYAFELRRRIMAGQAEIRARLTVRNMGLALTLQQLLESSAIGGHRVSAYAQHRPNLGNYEGQCPSILLQGEPSGPIGAVDALRPDQADAVADFAATERSGR